MFNTWARYSCPLFLPCSCSGVGKTPAADNGHPTDSCHAGRNATCGEPRDKREVGVMRATWSEGRGSQEHGWDASWSVRQQKNCALEASTRAKLLHQITVFSLEFTLLLHLLLLLCFSCHCDHFSSPESFLPFRTTSSPCRVRFGERTASLRVVRPRECTQHVIVSLDFNPLFLHHDYHAS